MNLPFNLDNDGYLPDSLMSANETSYTIWSQHEYKGKPALRFITIAKGITAYYK